MKRIFLSASIALLPTFALADSQLDRLEEISEKMNGIMFDMMIREIVNEGADPEPLRATVPDTSWNEAMREAGQCMLDKMIEASSKGAVDQMRSLRDLCGWMVSDASAGMPDVVVGM